MPGAQPALLGPSSRAIPGPLLFAQALFRRRSLKALVEVHGASGGLGGSLTADEIHVIQHALDLTSKSGQSAGACTPLDQVYMLPSDAVLDKKTLLSVMDSERSRIPVYQKGDR